MTRETTTIYPNQPDSTFPEFRKAGDALKSALTEAQVRNQEGAPTRSRELSLAITNIEQALHWLGCAPVKRDAAKVPYTVDDAQVAYPQPPADDEQGECDDGDEAEKPDTTDAYPPPPAGVYGVTAQEWTEVFAPVLEDTNRKIEELTSGVEERDRVIKRLRDDLAEAQERAEKSKAVMSDWIRKCDELRSERDEARSRHDQLVVAMEGFVRKLQDAADRWFPR